jgi:outer membrane protein, heavy metal efflux system
MHSYPSTGGRRIGFASLAAMLGLLAVLPGCAGRPAPTIPGTLGREVPVYRPSLADTARAPGAFQNPTGAITLRDAIALAFLNSPDLAAFAWETRAREARLVQAGQLPNPTLGFTAEDFGASTSLVGSDPSQAVQRQTTIQLSQLVELGGKRGARLDIAALDRDLAAWDYEAARIDVLTAVTKAFVDVLAAQEAVALTRQTAQLLEQVRQSVGERVVAGVVSPIEETRAGVAVAAARVEADRGARALEASRAHLASLWGAAAAFSAVQGDLNTVAEVPPIGALAARLSSNPDLARWAVEISQRRAAVSFERSKVIPDLTLSAGYRRFDDLNVSAFVLGGAITLPLFDRNPGGREEASSRLAKAYEERRAAEARVSSALADRYLALSSAYDEVIALRSTVMPGSQQTFAAISEGYQLGKFGYLDVLDAQRTSIAAGAQYLRALSDYHKAVADVERLLGAPLN